MSLLMNKTAIITGGSDGIGFAIAKAFAAQGANLILIGRDKEKLNHRKELLKQSGVTIHALAVDISNKDSIAELVEQVRVQNIKINIVVNNAGIARFVPFADTDIGVLDYHLNLNLKAPYLLTQAFLADLFDSQGNVINVSSYFARRMLPDRPSTAYSATKGAIESFTKALAFELGPKGVRVNAIAPGTIATQQVADNMERLDNRAKERFNAMINTIYPLQTIGEPNDIANMAVFLASDQAKWVTGGIFPVDGGLTTS